MFVYEIPTCFVKKISWALVSWDYEGSLKNTIFSNFGDFATFSSLAVSGFTFRAGLRKETIRGKLYEQLLSKKTFSWKSIFFRESTREVPFFLVLKLKYRDLARVRGAEAPHRNTVRGWNSLGMFDYISGIFDEKKFLSYCFVWAYRIFCVDFSWISPNYGILKAENMVFDF